MSYSFSALSIPYWKHPHSQQDRHMIDCLFKSTTVLNLLLCKLSAGVFRLSFRSWRLVIRPSGCFSFSFSPLSGWCRVVYHCSCSPVVLQGIKSSFSEIGNLRLFLSKKTVFLISSIPSKRVENNHAQAEVFGQSSSISNCKILLSNHSVKTVFPSLTCKRSLSIAMCFSVACLSMALWPSAEAFYAEVSAWNLESFLIILCCRIVYSDRNSCVAYLQTTLSSSVNICVNSM